MPMMTGGDAAVATLLKHGIDTLFGLPGIQNDGFYNALYDANQRGAGIRVIHTRHEQGAAYMALGYAWALDRVGVCNIVPGPGFLNASAALATAYGLNLPVLCLVGQIPTNKIGQGLGVLHEIPDQLAILQQFTKWAARADAPGAVATMLATALQQLQIGRPRPTGVEIPMDVLHGKDDLNPLAPLPLPEPTLEGDLDAAAQALGRAKRPLIYVGRGAQNVSLEVRQLSALLEAPVVGYRTGMGIMDTRHYRGFHMPASHPLWAEADVVLLVGTHARIPLQQWGVDDDMTIIKVDVDPATHDLIHTPDIAITGRAEQALPELLQLIPRHNSVRASREEELSVFKQRWQEAIAFLEPQRSFIGAIRDGLGEDGVFVDELTQVGYASRIVMPVYQPRTFISTGHMGTLGYGFPTALGVKVARPDVPVISVTGDGGFMFGVQELATAVQHDIRLITLLFNNNQFGNVQQMQRNKYGGRVIATDLRNPDFVQLAHAFGAYTESVDDANSLREAIGRAQQAQAPAVIEVRHGNVPSVDRFRKLGRVRG